MRRAASTACTCSTSSSRTSTCGTSLREEFNAAADAAGQPRRDLIALRRARDELRTGAYVQLDAPADAWAYRRGDSTTVALNLSDVPVAVTGLRGAVAIGTDRGRDGEAVDGGIELAPWEAAVVPG
jgi:hypothetical protein